jgi:serine protease Do
LIGSGFIVDKKGYIATADHVVLNASNAQVITTFTFPQTIGAKVINRDAKLDIALLKIDYDKELETVPIGDSSTVEAGNEIAIMGFPFGVKLWGIFVPAIHHGLVSCIVTLPNKINIFQLDIMANPGNSGGPLILKDNGSVIGIFNKIWTDKPIGDAITFGGKSITVPTGIARATPIEYLLKWL